MTFKSYINNNLKDSTNKSNPFGFTKIILNNNGL